MTEILSETGLPPIIDILPHQAPMILIDKLLDAGEEHIFCQLTVSPEHTFYDINNHSIPGWVGIELMAQAVAAWSGYRARQSGNPPPIGFLLGSRRYNSNTPAFNNGMVLDIKAERIMEDNGMAVFSCRIESNGEMLANSQLNAYVPSEQKLAKMKQEREAR